MLISRTIAIVLLLSATAANGSYWVSNFEGSADGYDVIRNNETIALEQLMLLEPGDMILIKKPGGGVLVIDEHNEHHKLTFDDTPYVVPESASPPRLLGNVRNWVASWWSTRGNQNTSSMSAVSRGGFEPTIIGAEDGDKLLLSGTRNLHLAWNGGIPPFDVTLTSESGEMLAKETDLPGYSASLPAVLLKGGQYHLQVAAGDAVSRITLMVTDAESLPDQAKEILKIDIPEEIRFGYIAMLLSGYADWRFEALQLAHHYELTQLELDLLADNFPAADIDEMAPVPDSSQTDQRTLLDEN